MSFWKSRADAQDRYRRELFSGTIVGRNDDGTYDVNLPGVAEPVRGVLCAGEIVLQEGNRVVLHRAGERNTWQIQSGLGAATPTRQVNGLALIDAPPLVHWGGLSRGAEQAETVTDYVDAHAWPLSALQQSGATDGQTPVWSAAAGAWVPGDVACGGGLDVQALRSPAAAALCGLIAQGTRPLVIPEGVGAWLAADSAESDAAVSYGAYTYGSTRYESLRAGAYPVKNGTLAYWKLDEQGWNDTALDCSGHLNDLTPHNLLSGQEGNFFWSRQLDGATSYFDRPALPLSTGNQLTIEAWMQPHTLVNNPMLFYQANGAAIQFDDGGTKVRFYIIAGTTAAAEAVINPATLCDGNWHYIAGVYDGACQRLYLDGEPVGSVPAQSGNVGGPVAPNCYVGVYGPAWTSWSRYYDGYLEEVRISQFAVSAGEIAQAWAGRDLRRAVSSPLVSPVPWRHVMLGAVAFLNNGSVQYEVSGDNGATWIPAEPWQWVTAPAPGDYWRVRTRLTNRAEVKRLGLIGMP